MILDFYILRRFALWLAISVVALWVIAAIVDLIESIDTFIDHAARPGQILRYYLFRSPYWIVLILPAAGMLATLFSLTGFAHRGEIAAMKAAGVSLQRILVPVLACALLFSLGAMLFTEYVVPPATFRYNTTRDDIRSYSRSDGSRRQVLLQDVGGQLVFARSYDHTRQRAQQVLWERRPADRTVERATAKRIEWKEKGWVAVAGTRYTLAGDRFEVSAFDTLTLSTLTLEPGDFSRQQKKPEEMNFAELRSYVDRARANGEDATRHLVDLHLKIAFPFACFAIVLVTAPLAANTRRSGRAASFGLGVLICFLLYTCVKAGQALGWNEIISPWQGAWAANLLFGLMGLVLLKRAHS
ncbi:MAG: LptF/LptG family permease [Gemmatimonadetes bacterium]|nr:LptF/LptG family permease [Gemmatimonadota bacterium]